MFEKLDRRDMKNMRLAGLENSFMSFMFLLSKKFHLGAAITPVL